MDDETETTPWQEITGRLRVVEGGRSTQPTTSSPISAASHRIEPEAFAAILTPALALVGGTGMSREDRREWMNAAYRALKHLPPDIFKRAASTAMQRADHPSKIVPAIVAAAEPMLASERAIDRMTAGAMTQALPAPGDSRCTGEEAAEICKRYGVGSSARAQPKRDAWKAKDVGHVADDRRPSRAPTREDYIRMGVDPAVLDRIEAERAA